VGQRTEFECTSKDITGVTVLESSGFTKCELAIVACQDKADRLRVFVLHTSPAKLDNFNPMGMVFGRRMPHVGSKPYEALQAKYKKDSGLGIPEGTDALAVFTLRRKGESVFRRSLFLHNTGHAGQLHEVHEVCDVVSGRFAVKYDLRSHELAVEDDDRAVVQSFALKDVLLSKLTVPSPSLSSKKAATNPLSPPAAVAAVTGGRLCVRCFAVLTVPPMIELDREKKIGVCSVDCMITWKRGDCYTCFHCHEQVPDPSSVAVMRMPGTNQAVWLCNQQCVLACDQARIAAIAAASSSK
jgi:hypothetical protein